MLRLIAEKCHAQPRPLPGVPWTQWWVEAVHGTYIKWLSIIAEASTRYVSSRGKPTLLPLHGFSTNHQLSLLNASRPPEVVEEVEYEHSVCAQQEKPLPGARRDVTLHEDDGEGEGDAKPMCHARTLVMSLLDCCI